MARHLYKVNVSTSRWRVIKRRSEERSPLVFGDPSHVEKRRKRVFFREGAAEKRKRVIFDSPDGTINADASSRGSHGPSGCTFPIVKTKPYHSPERGRVTPRPRENLLTDKIGTEQRIVRARLRRTNYTGACVRPANTL